MSPDYRLQEELYREQHLATDEPVIAYRCGERGLCALRVNRQVIPEVTLILNKTWLSALPFRTPPENFFNLHLVNTGRGDQTRIEGKTANRQRITVTVAFVPSTAS